MYGYTSFFKSINQLMDICCCLYFLIIMNNVAMNICGQVLLWTRFAQLFSKAPFYIPTSNECGFQFPYILNKTCCYLPFTCCHSHPSGCEVASHCASKFAFFWWLMILSLFLCVFCPSVLSLWRTVYSNCGIFLKIT